MAFQYRNNSYKDDNCKDGGYICTEGLQAREPAAAKENEHIKRSLHKIIKLHFDWKLRTV